MVATSYEVFYGVAKRETSPFSYNALLDGFLVDREATKMHGLVGAEVNDKPGT